MVSQLLLCDQLSADMSAARTQCGHQSPGPPPRPDALPMSSRNPDTATPDPASHQPRSYRRNGGHPADTSRPSQQHPISAPAYLTRQRPRPAPVAVRDPVTSDYSCYYPAGTESDHQRAPGRLLGSGRSRAMGLGLGQRNLGDERAGLGAPETAAITGGQGTRPGSLRLGCRKQAGKQTETGRDATGAL